MPNIALPPPRRRETLRYQPQIKHLRLRIQRAAGDSVPVVMAAQRSHSASAGAALIHIDCRDISALKQLENIEAFSEMLSSGIALVDEKGCIAFANAATEKMFGYRRGELENQPVASLLPSPLQRGSFEKHGEFFHDPKIAPHGLRPRVAWPPERRRRHFPAHFGLISIRLGEKRFAVASIADITDRNSIERKVREYEAQRTAIFSAGLVGDFTWNIDATRWKCPPRVFTLHRRGAIAGPVPAAWFRDRRHADSVTGLEKAG